MRFKRNMRHERFAELLGISADFLSLIERGVNAPSFETLDDMANGLGTSVADLLTFGKDESERR